jgi:nitrite reductase/ring-hydroxylating ferredoxin subunit/alkylhydroperoxidase/carboxymuconolactone decarboxylase family protein YurZ
MSRALDFLLAARPQAMSAYFDFLRDNGSRLEPKTRALISVITKAAVQTDKGLVQYTRKALACGCSADEILDALLMAFPALGLSRIVWAIDVLQAHAVPGFGAAPADDAAAPPVPDSTLDVCALTALPVEQAVKYVAATRPLLLYRQGEEVRAFKAYCTHQGMELMPSGIAGARVTCRQHGWQFELPEGRCSRGPGQPLEALPVRVAGGRVLVEWRD